MATDTHLAIDHVLYAQEETMLDARISSLVYRIAAVRRLILSEQAIQTSGVRLMRLKALLLKLQLRLRSAAGAGQALAVRGI